MSGLEVNGVNTDRRTHGIKATNPPKEDQKVDSVPVGQGYGAASGEGQVDKPASGVVNTYGNDFANFSKFKGNDKNDAFRLTASVYNTVKSQYMQLQHEYPNVVVEFEPMPNPQNYGKKREGFFNYQTALESWKNNALTLINNKREASTVEVVGAGVAAVVENDNLNTAMLSEQLTDLQKQLAEGTAQIVEEIKTGDGKIIQTIQTSTGAVCKLIKDSTGKILKGQTLIREDIGDFRAATKRNFKTLDKRNENRTGRIIGNQNRTANETQELEGIGQKITTNLTSHTNRAHYQGTIDRVNNMRNKILQSQANYETKKELLTHLAAFSTQIRMSDSELTAEEARIENRLKGK